MKRGMKKMKLTAKCKNTDMVGQAIGDIEIRTKSGVDRKIGGEDWNGMSWKTLSFYAIPAEVKKIKDDIEHEYGVEFI